MLDLHQQRSLLEKCPNTSYLSVFSPNAGKCGPEKTPYLYTFHTVDSLKRDIQIDDLAQGKCNGIKGWRYCLTSESKGRFLVNII